MSNGGHTTYDLGNLPGGWGDLVATSRNSHGGAWRSPYCIMCVLGGGLNGSEACMYVKIFNRVGKAQGVLDLHTPCVFCV